MKKMSFYARLGILVLLATAVIFTSCNKVNDGDNNNAAVAGIMGFNMAPDQEAIGITLNGNAISNIPLTYNSYTGMYVAVFAGNRQIRSYSATTGAILAETNVVLDTNKYYSVYFLGTTGHYKHVFAEDKFDEMSGTNGKAYIRYIQAIPDSAVSHINISAGSTNWVDEDAAYSHISNFVAIDPGEITVGINNGTNVDTTRSITVEEKKIYTILLMGQPDADNPEKAVQIKFVANGTLP